MDIIFSASIIAAFLAGMVALFAPCCITVLLPSYLAATFKEKRNILKMTFVFFAGISVILIPIGLGAAGLAQIFRDFHKELYIVGGLLMLGLAIAAFLGKGLTLMPLPKRIMPKPGSSHIKSVFALGVFSGAATSCCAPVLAGAMTLAVISGAFWKALIVTFAYVFGMVFPLFLLAYLYDKFKLEKSRLITGKILKMQFGGRAFSVHTTNLFAGTVFLIMGVALLALAFSGNAFWSPALQAEMGSTLNLWSQTAYDALSTIPDIFWGILLIGAFALLVYWTRKRSTT